MNNFGLYHNSQEKQLIKEAQSLAFKAKVWRLAEFACLLAVGVVCLVLLVSAYLGV